MVYLIYREPSQNNAPPNATFRPRCMPRLHAMLYRYFGENTVQMKRCVLSAVQATMTATRLAAVNTVSRPTCCFHASHCPSSSPTPFPSLPFSRITVLLSPSFCVIIVFSPLLQSSSSNKRPPTLSHQTLAAQLPTKIRTPTATTLKSLMPL